MTGFYYVYMLSDVATRTHHYVGMTEDIEKRLAKHNAGQVPHTSKFAPWIIDAAIAVRNKTIAAQLERYFKSGSGRAFANKHLFPSARTLSACSPPAAKSRSVQDSLCPGANHF